MQVASLELCKELYELSEWETSEWWNLYEDSDKPAFVSDGKEDYHRNLPAYDLGYLLRRLPVRTFVYQSSDSRRWVAHNRKYGERDNLAEADTPEDATAKLAIELFKQGVLTRGGDE